MEKEIFKDIVGYEGHYQISNLGRVKSISRKKNNGQTEYMSKEIYLKVWIDFYGYPSVSLKINKSQSKHKVHRLIAIHFIPNNENKPCVNHINGIKNDNRLKNLEWSTYSENNKHAYDNGLNISKKHNTRNKLTDIDVIDIKNRLTKGESSISISNFYKINPTTVCHINTNKTWNHLKN